MKLTPEEAKSFFQVWMKLLAWINLKHDLVHIADGEEWYLEDFMEIRNEMWENPQWIQEAINHNPEFTKKDKIIVQEWLNHYTKDQFVIFKHLATYSVFMTTDEPTKLYGVCGITDTFEEILEYAVPQMVNAVLLPFEGKIIYDTFLEPYPISFGPGMKKSLNHSYKTAKAKHGIQTVLGEEPPLSKPKSAATKSTANSEGKLAKANVPNNMTETYAKIAPLIEGFCQEKLNDDYQNICLEALAKLARKRPSPLLSGRPATWACGIVYAIATNNFIFDKHNPHKMTATELANGFGIAPSTAGNKAKEIILI